MDGGGKMEGDGRGREDREKEGPMNGIHFLFSYYYPAEGFFSRGPLHALYSLHPFLHFSHSLLFSSSSPPPTLLFFISILFFFWSASSFPIPHSPFSILSHHLSHPYLSSFTSSFPSPQPFGSEPPYPTQPEFERKDGKKRTGAACLLSSGFWGLVITS